MPSELGTSLTLQPDELVRTQIGMQIMPGYAQTAVNREPEYIHDDNIGTSLEIDTLLDLYIPKAGDPVDEALAQFINSLPENDRMKVLFQRLCEGVYKFGSRQIHLKIDQNKRVRV